MIMMIINMISRHLIVKHAVVLRGPCSDHNDDDHVQDNDHAHDYKESDHTSKPWCCMATVVVMRMLTIMLMNCGGDKDEDHDNDHDHHGHGL